MAAPSECEMCGKFDNPTVPPLNVCPMCLLKTRMEKLELEEFQVEFQEESLGLSFLFGDDTFNEFETQEKARDAIKVMMSVHVPKQSTGEAGKFEPTFGDVQVMEALAPDVCLRLRKGSLRQFHSILHPVNNLVDWEKGLKGTLFEVFGSKQKDINEYTDQNRRAKKLVEEMKIRNSQKVFLLDGHGRMLLSIVHEMIEQDLDPESKEFVVVDIDEECHCFHEHLFPQSVTCECKDVLDIELGETDMLYMNFCSIPPRDKDNIFFNKEEVLKWVWERMKTMECGIMISAMIRDTRQAIEANNDMTLTVAGPRTTDFHLCPAGLEEVLEREHTDPEQYLFRAEKVSSRHKFKTWLITPERCAAKQNQLQNINPHNLQRWFTDQRITWDYKTELREDVYAICEGERYLIKRRTMCRVVMKRANGEERQKDIKFVHKDENQEPWD